MHRRPRALLAVLLAFVLAFAPLTARADAVAKLTDPDTSARWEEVFGSGAGTYTTEPVGAFTATNESGSTVALTNCQWGGAADANGIAELVILTKLNA